MKVSTVVLAALSAALSTVNAHEGHDHDLETTTDVLGPSPTESANCVAHGDHWHCETKTSSIHSSVVLPIVVTDSVVIPTTSIEIVTGLSTTSAANITSASHTSTGILTTTTTAAHDHDGDDAEEHGHSTLAPSPTESYGCTPHGDHWHCDGPVTKLTTTTVRNNATGTTNGTAPPSATAPVSNSGHTTIMHGSAILFGVLAVAFFQL
ncbi:hypothetical protein DFH27DRAFT_649552 [Peziza echinospora]|nr:hypothetical protein DFH27DRAFT_649552 [Peziza echinospora]